jgi:prophage regulatory protein
MKFLRIDGVIELRGKGRSSNYSDVQAGLLTTPVKIGLRAVAWPEHEVLAINAARAAGKSDDEIRMLVTRLVADRKQAA